MLISYLSVWSTNYCKPLISQESRTTIGWQDASQVHCSYPLKSEAFMRASETTRISIDSSLILASINQPVTSDDIRHYAEATALLDRISDGGVLPPGSEIALYECFCLAEVKDRTMTSQAFCSMFRCFPDWPLSGTTNEERRST
jgi:hypothetical protein